MLQELVQKLQDDHGLSSEQSHGILSTVTEFIKEKFPMMKGAIENMFSGQHTTTQATTTASAATDAVKEEVGEKKEGIMEKAEEMFENVKEKVGGLFGAK